MSDVAGAVRKEIPFPGRSLHVAQIYDLFLDWQRSQDGPRAVAGDLPFRGSKIGSCLQAQLLAARGVPGRFEADAISLRRFAVGDSHGALLVAAFRKLGILLGEEVAVTKPEWGVGGHVDAIIGGEVPDTSDPALRTLRDRLVAAFGRQLPVVGLEIKSVQSRSFWWRKKNGETTAQEHQLDQAACYSLLTEGTEWECDQWRVLSVSKDDLTIAEDTVSEQDRLRVLAKIKRLNRALADGSDLPCTCISSGWAYAFCEYRSADADELWANRRSNGKRLPKTCCEEGS